MDTNVEEPGGSVICVRRAAHSLEHARQGVAQNAMLTRQRFVEEAPVTGTCRPGVFDTLGRKLLRCSVSVSGAGMCYTQEYGTAWLIR